MDFFRKKREQRQQPSESLPTTASSDVKSSDTTPYHSGVPSEFEKEIPREPSVHSAQSKSTHPSEDAKAEGEKETAIQSAEKKLDAIEKEEEEENDDGVTYPTGVKLTLITIALCLSVFCMGMLSPVRA